MKKLLIPAILAALGVGYLWGGGWQSSDNITDTTLERAPTAHGESQEAIIPGAQHIHAIAYDGEDNLLLGAHGGLFKSVDGGKNWQRVQTKGDLAADDWMSLVFDPRDRRIIFAGGHDLGVVKSVDGGVTWTRSDQGIKGTDIHGLAINQRNPDFLFAYAVGSGIFKSEDGGSSWRRMDDGPENPGVRTLEYMAVQTSMDRSMGWDTWGLLFAGTADGLFQSFSCFCGWTKNTAVFDNTTLYSLATLHQDAGAMYAGTKEGMWRTLDAGKTWEKLKGIEPIKITAIAIQPKNSQELTAASEEGAIYRSGDSGVSWQRVN